MSLVYEFEMSEMQTCLCRCTRNNDFSKARSNNYVRSSCQKSLNQHLNLKITCCGNETGMCASAQCMKALKNMRATWCLSTPPATSRFSVFRSRVAFQVRERKCTGIPFGGQGKCSFFLHHLSDEQIELFPPCQSLQSCHCQLRPCGCVEVLLSCRRTCSRCLSFAFCKSECLAVATVSAPPAVVCLK